MGHGLTYFLLPPPLDRLPFLFSNLGLPVEALNGHERVLYGGLHRNPELGFLLAKLEGTSFRDLWELPQDFQRNVPIGCGNLYLGVMILLTLRGAMTQ
jgi:hypothetical protein